MIKEKINMELLGDDELDAITGGTKSLQVMKVACRKCKKNINIIGLFNVIVRSKSQAL